MKLTDESFGALAICSVRYALRRQTYMPSVVCGIVAANVEHLLKGDLDTLIRDIEKPSCATVEDRETKKAWGAECDYLDWMKLAGALRDERTKREVL